MEVTPTLIAAHELKAPLANLRQLAFAIEGCPDPARRQRLAARMVSVSDRALRQVQDLTKVARLEDALFEMEPVAVRAVCDDVMRELSHLFRYDHRSLAISYRNKSRLVTANRDLLFSIIYNFCLNALHYSAADTNSALAVADRSGKVRISVRDYGPTLPVAVWRELRAGRVNQPLPVAMRPESSGLGLYIASKFSRYMHADVGAVRHRDGTTFFVDLPISKQATLFP